MAAAVLLANCAMPPESESAPPPIMFFVMLTTSEGIDDVVGESCNDDATLADNVIYSFRSSQHDEKAEVHFSFRRNGTICQR